jgi:hypothetical protein
MCSNINIFLKDSFKDFFKWKNKGKKIFPKEYANATAIENTEIIDLQEKTVTSTRTSAQISAQISALTLKDNEEFCFYINELSEWTYIL